MIYHDKYFSPNFGYPKGKKGRNGHKVIGIGVHISGAEWTSNYNWIMNPAANASYNTIIDRTGKIIQLVPESDAAYSHGRIQKPNWPLLKTGVNPNLYTLSVSRVGSNQNTWDPPQMDSMVKYILYAANKYGFEPKWPYVFGHQHIDSVGRWYCPGKPFLDELYNCLARATVIPVETPAKLLPVITREVGIEVDGKLVKETGYLINGATHMRGSFLAGLGQIDSIVGMGNFIKIRTKPYEY